MTISTINPFYAARITPSARPERAEAISPTYARLPLAPRNTSPVPHLTSLYHFDRAGEYGDRSYPGNCGGNCSVSTQVAQWEKRSKTFWGEVRKALKGGKSNESRKKMFGSKVEDIAGRVVRYGGHIGVVPS